MVLGAVEPGAEAAVATGASGSWTGGHLPQFCWNQSRSLVERNAVPRIASQSVRSAVSMGSTAATGGKFVSEAATPKLQALSSITTSDRRANEATGSDRCDTRVPAPDSTQ